MDGPVGQIRVRVFPHIGAYVGPHGKDTRIDRVTLRAVGQGGPLCHLYGPDAGSNGTGPPLLDAAEFDLTSADLPSQRWIRCDGPVEIVREAGLAARTYSGTLRAVAGHAADGRPLVELVEYLPFEDYLQGVVPAEVPPSWEGAALQAQAVAARSYAYFQVRQAQSMQPPQDYDVDDTVQYQAYLGQGGWQASTNAAVQSTAGRILTYGQEVAKAYFHADSGGHTEDAKNVWPEDADHVPYCAGKPEVYDLSLHDSRWSMVTSLAELQDRLVGQGLMSATRRLKSVVTDPVTYPSGRVRIVRLGFADGGSAAVASERFRYAAGLRSTWFSVSPFADARELPGVRFEGRGYGHGVGMNQWGAQLLAQSLGWDFQRILEFYYSGVSLTEN
jgi:SpoIID/LytB domain protein